jgi:hypothetical protein
MSLGLTLFSYYTNSLFIYNAIVYMIVFLWGAVLYFIGQTIFSFDVLSNIDGKKYRFECRSIGNDIGLKSFVEKLKIQQI